MDLKKYLKFSPTGIKAGKGSLLLSEPFMQDYFFKRAVLLIAEHDKAGSFGLIVNKKTDYKINEIAVDFPEFDAYVYLGGPVQTENIFFLHTRGDIIDESFEIIDGVFWGGNYDTIKTLIKEGILKPDEIRFYLGYSGWSENQLETELVNESWLVSNVGKKDIFSEKPDSLWNKIVKSFGNKYKLWLNFPVNPQMN